MSHIGRGVDSFTFISTSIVILMQMQSVVTALRDRGHNLDVDGAEEPP